MQVSEKARRVAAARAMAAVVSHAVENGYTIHGPLFGPFKSVTAVWDRSVSPAVQVVTTVPA